MYCILMLFTKVNTKQTLCIKKTHTFTLIHPPSHTQTLKPILQGLWSHLDNSECLNKHSDILIWACPTLLRTFYWYYDALLIYIHLYTTFLLHILGSWPSLWPTLNKSYFSLLIVYKTHKNRCTFLLSLRASTFLSSRRV